MTETVRQVCTRAARKIGVSSEGQPAPVAYDMDVLKDHLTAWYYTAIEGGLFGALTDVAVSADYEANENERVTNTETTSISVTAPATITDACTGIERTPYDLSVIQVAGTTPTTWIYDASVADWLQLETLTLDDYAPLSARSADGLASVVAVLIMEERGMEPGPLTVNRAARYRLALAAKHGTERRAVAHTFY